MQNKIYVGNLSYSATQDDLREFFSDCGDIQDLAIPQDRETGRVRGFAFVTFEKPMAAQEALNKNGVEFLGRTIKVNLAKERREQGREVV